MLPVANPTVIYKALTDGAVLFSTTDEVYFGLNDVGARVWELLPPALDTMGELCAAIGSEYPDIAPETIAADVAELLAQLTEYGLVVPRESQSSAENGVATADTQAAHPQRARVD